MSPQFEVICYHFPPKEQKLATPQELSHFLADVERRAYKQAQFAVRNHEIALDIVQDAMLKLAEKYGERPPEELPLLFQRILQNAIRDHYRRQKIRDLWTTLFSSLSAKHGEEDQDPLETLGDDENNSAPLGPESVLQQKQVVSMIEKAMTKLPPRQREAFLLRYWEGMDISETATIMGCTEGSVKTHCSRATHALSAMLEKEGIHLT